MNQPVVGVPQMLPARVIDTSTDSREILRHAKIAADLPSQMVVDLAVPRNRRNAPRSGIDENRVLGTFPQKRTSVLPEVPHEIAALHAAGLKGSRMTDLPWMSCSAS